MRVVCGVFTLTLTFFLRELTGVGIRGFHPHPSPLPEGEGVCWLPIMPVCTPLPTPVSPRGERTFDLPPGLA